MAFSNALEDRVLNFVFGKVYYSPFELVLGLSLANPLDDESGLDEPSVDDGYERVQTVLGVYPYSDWLYAAAGGVANRHTFTFPTATGDWGLIKYFVLFDALQMLIYGELNPHVNVTTGQKPRFNPTKLEIFLS